jgi:rhomboid protease GluP
LPEPLSNTSPFQRLPPLIVVLACAILGIEAIFQLGARGIIGGAGAVGWRLQAVMAIGFFDALFDHMLVTRSPSPDGLMRFLTYGFVHAAMMQALFGAVLLLALGKAVSARFSSLAMAVIMIAAAATGALAFGLFQDCRAPLIGIYPAVYGLIGAYTCMLFTAADGRRRIMAFRLIALLSVLRLAFLLVAGGSNDWIADMAGFGTGLALSALLVSRSQANWWKSRTAGDP